MAYKCFISYAVEFLYGEHGPVMGSCYSGSRYSIGCIIHHPARDLACWLPQFKVMSNPRRAPISPTWNPSTRGLRYVWPRTVRDPDPAPRSRDPQLQLWRDHHVHVRSRTELPSRSHELRNTGPETTPPGQSPRQPSVTDVSMHPQWRIHPPSTW